MATFRNVFGFSVDVEESAHDGHEIDPGELFVLDDGEPDVLGAHVRCLPCDEEFLAFKEEIEE